MESGDGLALVTPYYPGRSDTRVTAEPRVAGHKSKAARSSIPRRKRRCLQSPSGAHSIAASPASPSNGEPFHAERQCRVQTATGESSPDDLHQVDGERQYRGVRQRRWGRWVSEIREPRRGLRIWLGSHGSAEQAARVYDVAVRLLRGDGAMLNFPDDQREVPLPPAIAESLINACAALNAHTHHPPPPPLTPTHSPPPPLSPSTPLRLLSPISPAPAAPEPTEPRQGAPLASDRSALGALLPTEPAESGRLDAADAGERGEEHGGRGVCLTGGLQHRTTQGRKRKVLWLLLLL
ncbi:hypothetical protein CLOM_g14397 [Closterium sp. NIES-68]|nr:hypothetical protein CLOM_g22839 [Closterium sp. NIES-68]GJP55453.1 hypothetical protein CLOM_g14397 [Closterium sp. NIES-68]